MDRQLPYILAIESSCDDTSAAVLHGRKVLSNIIATQKVHEKYGGVIPELASRSHQKNIVPVVDAALKEAGIDHHHLSAVAYTQGPGLPGSLVVGNAFAKSLSLALEIPLIAVNHIQAHILAHFIEGVHASGPDFPFLCLTVSGGHTQIVRVEAPDQMKLLGTTIDDAAGEAFDKVAKLLGLPYPGGPLVDQKAREGNASAFSFPKPKVEGDNYSFSGLKTSVLYFLKKQLSENPEFIQENLNDICASVQAVIVEILLEKLEVVALREGIKDVALAGGVSANSGLRKAIGDKANHHGWRTFIPPIQYCTDNAAMIGITGLFMLENGQSHGLDSVSSARLPF